MTKEIILIILFSCSFLLATAILFRFYLKFKLKKFSNYQYEFIKLPKNLTKKPNAVILEESLSKIGKEYQKTSLDQIILIHGTFAGDDPFYLNSTFEHKTPKKFKSIHTFIRKSSKTSFDFLGRDKGNFTLKHQELLQKYFSQEVSLFNWSGSNTHLARLRGAIELIHALERNALNGKNNFLILAHSHGGQILALLSRFLSEKKFLEELIKEELIEASIKEKIHKLKKNKFYFVTMGTPVRYPWYLSSNVSAIHLINHRGVLPQGGHYVGSLWTRGGDYVQQYGGAGSDYYTLIDMNKKTNQRLKTLLDEKDVSFFNFLKRRERLHNKGLNLLIDYKDSTVYPNFYQSVFGHAIYTRYYLLSFHLKLALEKLNL